MSTRTIDDSLQNAVAPSVRRIMYSVDVADVPEVELVDAAFELFQNLVVTSHVRRQYQLPQLLHTNAVK